MIPLAVQPWQLLCGELRFEQILDLREPDRFARGHLAGAVNIPYGQVQEAGPAQLDPTRPVLVVDPAGARAAEMAVWLRARGFDAGYLEGGMATWTGPLAR